MRGVRREEGERLARLRGVGEGVLGVGGIGVRREVAQAVAQGRLDGPRGQVCQLRGSVIDAQLQAHVARREAEQQPAVDTPQLVAVDAKTGRMTSAEALTIPPNERGYFPQTPWR